MERIYQEEWLANGCEQNHWGCRDCGEQDGFLYTSSSGGKEPLRDGTEFPRRWNGHSLVRSRLLCGQCAYDRNLIALDELRSWNRDLDDLELGRGIRP